MKKIMEKIRKLTKALSTKYYVLRTAKIRWAFLVAVILIVGGGVVLFWNVKNNPAPIVEPEIKTPILRRAIDGVPVAEGWTEPVPFAVVIENSIDAWPVSGISKANLVFEAPAEAGITRFLAVFADGGEVEKIGPVRSARPYYVDWAEEFGALFAHVGGSPEALALIPSRDIFDLNQYWNGADFWRSKDRPAPHNVYTSNELLKEAIRRLVDNHVIDGLSDRTIEFQNWKFKDDAPREARPMGQEFSVVFGNPIYTVTWKYNPETNEYVRWQLNQVYRDADNLEVHAKNVVIMSTDIEITDAVGRRRIKTIGEGAATMIQDGTTIKGSWKRETRENRTKFFDASGEEIAFNAGLTWIEVTDVTNNLIVIQ